MVYTMRKDKARDIARGVLPSTARKGARENKKNFHAKHRSQQRRTNDAICRSMNAVDEDGHIYTDPELFDDVEEQLVYDGYHASTKDPSLGWDDMSSIVWDRRQADKLGPLLRWARATHDRLMTGPEWTTSDKVAYFKDVLPDTLQGRHALGHVVQSLGLDEDVFRYGYREPFVPSTKEDFRAGLDKILSTSKGRMEFHDFRLETIPAAAHRGEANNKVETLVHAVNENGEGLYYDPYSNWPRLGTIESFRSKDRPLLRKRMVTAYVPQPVAETCDVCSFLRNDPLSTPQAVTEFTDLVWDSVRNRRYRWQRMSALSEEHRYMIEIIDHVLAHGENE